MKTWIDNPKDKIKKELSRFATTFAQLSTYLNEDRKFNETYSPHNEVAVGYIDKDGFPIYPCPPHNFNNYTTNELIEWFKMILDHTDTSIYFTYEINLEEGKNND